MGINRPDAPVIIEALDRLIQQPIYSISHVALERYEWEYFDERCKKSKKMISQAMEVIPGGVQHNLAFNHPFPLVFTEANGANLTDLDGNEYYDFLQAGGPTVLGSNPDSVREKVFELLENCGPSTGLFHEYEMKIAQLIRDLIPSVDMFRALGSGTEACMAATRVARLATGKKHVLKMGGAYHGWSDQLAYGIRAAGSKALLAHGVPRAVFRYTDEFFPGDLDALERKLKAKRFRGGTAAIMIDPLGPESGTRPVTEEFIRGTRGLANKYGAQGVLGVMPDLTVFGKVIAGGYPGAGGLGGKKEYMKYLAAGIQTGDKTKRPLVGGTLAATPLSSVAGYYTLKEIAETGACQKANAVGDRMTDGLHALIRKHGLPFVASNQGAVCRLETVGTMHFTVDWKRPWTIPHLLEETSKRKKEMEHMGAAYMAEGVVTLAGRRLYTNAAYTDDDIDGALAAFDRVFDHVVKM